METSQTETAQSADDVRRLREENRWLRNRIARLEKELAAVQAKADEQVAYWQERAYWLDRWHIDLNKLMERRSAQRALSYLKVVRSYYRSAKNRKRRLEARLRRQR